MYAAQYWPQHSNHISLEDKSMSNLLLKLVRKESNAATNAESETLQWAVKNRCATVIKLLAGDAQKDLSLQDFYSTKPDLEAILQEQEDFNLLILILETIGLEIFKSDDEKNRLSFLRCIAHGGSPTNVEIVFKWWPFGIMTKRTRHEFTSALLLNEKLNINEQIARGRTPLSWAIHNGEEGVAMSLLERGKADVNAKDVDGKTPLFAAMHQGSPAMVAHLIQDPNTRLNMSYHDWMPLK